MCLGRHSVSITITPKSQLPRWTINTLNQKLWWASYPDDPHTMKSHYIDWPVTSNSVHAVQGTSVPSALSAPGTDARTVYHVPRQAFSLYYDYSDEPVTPICHVHRIASYPDVIRPSNGQLPRCDTFTEGPVTSNEPLTRWVKNFDESLRKMSQLPRCDMYIE